MQKGAQRQTARLRSVSSPHAFQEMFYMSSLRPFAPRESAAELRATAMRLFAVVALAVLVGLAARLSMGPPLY